MWFCQLDDFAVTFEEFPTSISSYNIQTNKRKSLSSDIRSLLSSKQLQRCFNFVGVEVAAGAKGASSKWHVIPSDYCHFSQTLCKVYKSQLSYSVLNHLLTVSPTCFCFTRGGYSSSQSSGIHHQYATLMSPNKVKTPACGSYIFYTC